MKKMILTVLMVLMAWTTVSAADVHNISSREARTLLEKNRKVFLLDVRTPQEYSQARLPGSVLIPVNELEHRIKEVPRDKSILVYCTVGSRSKVAAGYLSNHGYKDVFNMSDGITGWYSHGFQIER